MQKVSYIAVVLFTVFLISSCSDDQDELEIGNVFDNSSSSIFYTDTITVNASTVLLDSFNTSGYEKVFLGNKYNDNFGKITANSYVPMGFSYDEPNIGDGAVFDSLVLVLTPNGEYLGDTTITRKLLVYEVLDTIAPNDNGYFYTNTTFDIDDTPLVNQSFKIRPKEGRKLYFRFPDELGEDWLDKILNGDENFDADYDFQEFFKGIALFPGDTINTWSASFYGETAITDDGESSDIEIRLYYTYEHSEENEYYSFITSNSSYIYTHYTVDHSNTSLDLLTDDNSQLSSYDLNNLAFMQAGGGLGIKINIPVLERIHELNSNLTLISADLIFKPKKGSYGNENPLPTSFNVYWTDKKNRIGESLYDISGEEAITGTLYEDNEFKENTYYSFSVFSYMLTEMSTEEYSDNDLMLLFTSETLSTSFTSLVFEDNDLNKLSMKLRLYYMTY